MQRGTLPRLSLLVDSCFGGQQVGRSCHIMAEGAFILCRLLGSCSPEFERSQPPPINRAGRDGMYTEAGANRGLLHSGVKRNGTCFFFFLLEFGNYLWSLNINVKQLGSNACLVLMSLTQCFITALNKIYIQYILIYIFILCFSPALEVIAATPDLSISHKPIKEKPLDFLQCSLLKLKITDAAP